jgi:hypothetical protein
MRKLFATLAILGGLTLSAVSPAMASSHYRRHHYRHYHHRHHVTVIYHR